MGIDIFTPAVIAANTIVSINFFRSLSKNGFPSKAIRSVKGGHLHQRLQMRKNPQFTQSLVFFNSYKIITQYTLFPAFFPYYMATFQ